MATRTNRVILLVLVVLAVGSFWRAISVEQEKRRIAGSYQQAQEMVQQLEDERAHLNDELVNARQTLEGQAGNITNLQQELQNVQEKLDQTVAELSSLQRDHELVRQQNSSLASQLSSVMTEKQQLEAKLSSLKELRLAIRDVKRQMWNERWAAWRARVDAFKREDQERLASGNHGYIVRQGVPTLGSSQKLQVHVLEPQTQ